MDKKYPLRKGIRLSKEQNLKLRKASKAVKPNVSESEIIRYLIDKYL